MEAPHDSKLIDAVSTFVGRIVLAHWIPRLRELSDDGAHSRLKIYRLPLTVVSLLVLYIVTGVVVTLFLWVKGDIHSAGYLLGLSVGALVALIVIAVTLKKWIGERELDLASQSTLERHRDFDAIRKDLEAEEEKLFERNLNDAFVLKAFHWSGTTFFQDGRYHFAPRVNVLLGKNGYGKTLLLRSLAALLQRDGKYSSLLFPISNVSQSVQPTPCLGVVVTRNGETEDIVRDTTYFRDLVGKIPLLAIPDSRFVNRADPTVPAASISEPLHQSGARQFLTQEPYESVVRDLLTHLCLDYHGIRSDTRKRRYRGLDQPIFRLVESVVRELTEDEDFGFAAIDRRGAKFQVLVKTSGSPDVPIPIQSASQGALSVVAIFGLIYTFLQSLRPKLREEEVAATSGIVLIDEIDAHLHLSWQQKILGMLTRTFPNVQFVVSAHSPVIVAGCDKGEVSVLRKSPDTGVFFVDPLERDFLGVTAQELYRQVFEIEDIDRLYLEYATKDLAGYQNELEQRAKTSLSPTEEEQLWRETRLLRRAAEAREQRSKSQDMKAHIAQLESEVARLAFKLREEERQRRVPEVDAQERSEEGDVPG